MQQVLRSALGCLAFSFVTSTTSADVVITETVAGKTGGKSVEGLRTTYIKDTRMRIESVQGGESAIVLYDLPAGATIGLNPAKKRAEIREIRVRAAELDKQYPRERVSVIVTPTGTTRDIAGAACAEHVFAIRVPMTKSGETVLKMNGSAWIAKDAPGVDDYARFAKAAADGQLVLGVASNNVILLALTRGQTELYRALSEAHGLPYLIEMTTEVEGHGMLAGMLKKLLTGTRRSLVRTVTVTAVPDAMFAIPDGWKRENK